MIGIEQMADAIKELLELSTDGKMDLDEHYTILGINPGHLDTWASMTGSTDSVELLLALPEMGPFLESLKGVKKLAFCMGVVIGRQHPAPITEAIARLEAGETP